MVQADGAKIRSSHPRICPMTAKQKPKWSVPSQRFVLWLDAQKGILTGRETYRKKKVKTVVSHNLMRRLVSDEESQYVKSRTEQCGYDGAHDACKARQHHRICRVDPVAREKKKGTLTAEKRPIDLFLFFKNFRIKMKWQRRIGAIRR